MEIIMFFAMLSVVGFLLILFIICYKQINNCIKNYLFIQEILNKHISEDIKSFAAIYRELTKLKNDDLEE